VLIGRPLRRPTRVSVGPPRRRVIGFTTWRMKNPEGTYACVLVWFLLMIRTSLPTMRSERAAAQGRKPRAPAVLRESRDRHLLSRTQVRVEEGGAGVRRTTPQPRYQTEQ
jgi:hypothetical protein